MKVLKTIGSVCVMLMLTSSTMLVLQHRHLKNNTVDTAKSMSQLSLQDSDSLLDKNGLTNLPLLKPLIAPRPHLKILTAPNITQKVPDHLLRQNINWSMIVAIKSDYRHYLRRKAIRESWAAMTFINGVRMHVIFVVALPETPEEDVSLKKESNKFRDILQVQMNETYQGVGFKAMASMQWIGDNFPDDWIYFSADDDILPDFNSLLSHMQTLFNEAKKVSNYTRSLPIYCAYHYQTAAWVQRSGKWAVKESEYPHKKYPPMCEGGFYGLSVKLTKAIYNASRYYPYFRHDDIFLTAFMRLAVCDTMRDDFCFDFTDFSCGISKLQNWNFKHLKIEPKAYTELWKEVEIQMRESGVTILKTPL